MTGQGDHYLGVRIKAIELGVASRLKDGANLHLHDVGVDDTQADTAQTHHGVAFVQSHNNIEQVLFFCQAFGDTLGFQGGNFGQEVFHAGQELVQGRIDQANDHG